MAFPLKRVIKVVIYVTFGSFGDFSQKTVNEQALSRIPGINSLLTGNNPECLIIRLKGTLGCGKVVKRWSFMHQNGHKTVIKLLLFDHFSRFLLV